jgi:aminopeptidase N
MKFRKLSALLGATSLFAFGSVALAAEEAAPDMAAAPVVTAAMAAATAAPYSAEPVTTQLPRNAVPSHYRIRFTPDAANLKFAANTSIDVKLLTPSESVTLHAADLEFSKVTIRKAKGKPVPAKVVVDAKAQTATFTFPKMAAGNYTLDIDYTGKIAQQANGMFALDYKNPEGQDKRALFTQFEAPDARRFIPSWDEPNYKATFDMTAIVPSDLMPVSNMPIVSTKAATGGKSTVTFQRSPKMSTYLLFFGLGEFDRITTKVGPTEVGVIMGKGNAAKGQYALDASAKIVAYFNDYFGVPYPLPKLDNVAGPGQSQFFSAMENWGAIFTFERVLLDDPKITSARAKQRIFQTDAHEIAHQWFGNLVTMKWWDDLWLNEGFASWMESKTTAHFNPDWQAEIDRVGGREAAMGLDAYATTHPVVQKITTVEQTSQAFDTITYQKGEAVITMLEGFAGENVWRDGIRAYMKKHAYGNTSTSDLWHAVEAAGAKGLTKIANDFTKKPGIPLIAVKAAMCEAGNTHVELTQSEFSRDRKAATAANPQSWNVPVIAQTLGGKPVSSIISGGMGHMMVPGCGPLLVNAGQSGYYRTQYTPEMDKALAQNFAKLAPIDQVGILANSGSLSAGDYQPISVALDYLDAVPIDASQRVMESASRRFDGFYDQFKSDTARQSKIAAITTQRFAGKLKQLGFKPIAGEPLLDANLRSSLIGTLGGMGDPSVRDEANRLFTALDSNPAALDGPLRTTWLSIIAYNADQKTWDKMRGLGKTAVSQPVRSTLYSLLGTTKDAALADQALKLALTEEPGPTVSPGIIAAVSGNHPDKAFDFALANLPKVEQLIDLASRSEFLAQLGSGSDDPAMVKKLDDYAKAHLNADSRKPVDQAIVAIKTRLANEARIKSGVAAWLDAHK